MRPKLELEMIARPQDITSTAPSTPDLASAETPLQRQILLWQRELLRRKEAERGSGQDDVGSQLPETEHQTEV